MKKKRIFMLSVMIDRMDDDMPFHMFNLIKHGAIVEIDRAKKVKRKNERPKKNRSPLKHD